MAIERVAIIFDDELRPETTGRYCLEALRSLAAVEHFRPSQLDRIGPTSFDLFVSIDDGLHYAIPPALRPCAYWAIDTHLDFDSALSKSRQFDHVFAAQRDGSERLTAAGVPTLWLPLACDARLFEQQSVPKIYDYCFVGNLFSGDRSELVHLIRQQFRNNYVGQLYFEDMVRVYCASRLVFNRSIKNDINMRVFEAVASGSLLMTNDLENNGQDELLRDGVHLATYRDADELLDKSRYYLEHVDTREAIAARGRVEVLANHTYRHRMSTLLAASERATSVPLGAVHFDTQSDRQVSIPCVSTEAAAGASTEFHRPAPGCAQNLAYFDFPRPELLALVPNTARRILEVGCGTGQLGASIKARQPAHVTGIELNPRAAALARERFDQVVVGDLEEMDCGFSPSAFDCIICGDVLEHLRQPDTVLRQIHNWLEPDGRLIASVPNVRNQSVISALLEGNWTYESAGLLDTTHLRFFTRLEIERLLYRTNFDVEQLSIVPGSGYEEWTAKGRPGQVRLANIDIVGLPVDEAEEFFTYQFLVEAKRREPFRFGLTSIVIVTHNELAFTKQCVESIQECTDEPFELIFVDNASTDGTLEYLRALPASRVIENSDNRGFPAAVNQGIGIASGDQILLLNNDVIVTTGWLRRLIAALQSDHSIGLIGPVTNCTSGPQRVDVSYRDLQGLEGFAWRWAKNNRGLFVDTEALMGFCLLMRSSLVRDLGAFDERFGLGLYEDVDFSCRARRAGYRAVVVREVFVHHFGHRTFIGAQVDADKLLKVNERRYAEKWQIDPSAIHVQPRSIDEMGSGGAGVDFQPTSSMSHHQDVGVRDQLVRLL